MKTEIAVEQDGTRLQLLKALTTFRLVVISFFLGLLVIFQMTLGELRYPFILSMLAAATYLVSIIYLLLLRTAYKYPLFISVQFATDLVIESGIIYFGGGIASPFTFLYMLTVIASAIALPRPSTYIVASVASILYGLFANLEFYGKINPVPLLLHEAMPLSQGYVFFNVLSHIGAFFLVAYLSDILSQRVKDTLLALLLKEKDLTYLQAFHRKIIEHMGSGFLALGLNKQIVSSNQAARKILGIRAENLELMNIENVFPGQPSSAFLPQDEAGIAEAVNSEIEYQSPDGNIKQLTITASPFLDSEKRFKGYIVIFQDVTSLRRMEAAIARADRLASLGRISAGIAHEIRNPLASISGSIQMLKTKDGKNHESESKLMEIILRETERLNTIIDGLLSSSSTTLKKKKEVRPSEIISDALLLFCNHAQYSGRVELKTDIDETLMVEADPEALKQVFWNLLINAAQAMPEGGAISISMKSGSNNDCVFVFSDTGSGIPREDLTKIFEPFYTTKEKGTGLGLASVLKIVENHSGTINIDTRPGEGTDFIITLPKSG